MVTSAKAAADRATAGVAALHRGLTGGENTGSVREAPFFNNLLDVPARSPVAGTNQKRGFSINSMATASTSLRVLIVTPEVAKLPIGSVVCPPLLGRPPKRPGRFR